MSAMQMHRYASVYEVGWEEGEARTGSRAQLLQAARPHRQ